MKNSMTLNNPNRINYNKTKKKKKKRRNPLPKIIPILLEMTQYKIRKKIDQRLPVEKDLRLLVAVAEVAVEASRKTKTMMDLLR